MRNKVLTHGDTATVWIERKGVEYPCLIDVVDLPTVEKVAGLWFLNPGGKRTYAVANVTNRGYGASISMHRLIAHPGMGMVSDHIDGDGLNNRRANLRAASPSENSLNRSSLHPTNTTGVRGVSRVNNKYRARVYVKGKACNLGDYRDLQSAALAVRAKLIELGAPAENVIRTTTVGGVA